MSPQLPPRRLLRALCALLATCLLFACGDDENTTPTDTRQDSAGDVSPDATATDTVDTVEVDPREALYAPMRVAFTYRDNNNLTEEIPLLISGNDPSFVALGDGDFAAMTSGIDCAIGLCLVTADMQTFIYRTNSGELRVAAIGSGPMVNSADLQLLQSDVKAGTVQLSGTRLAYVAGVGAAEKAYAMDLANGLTTPTELGLLVTQLGDGVDYSGGGVAVGARGDYALIYRYDLASIAVFAVPLAGGAERFLYRFGVPNFVGSYFSGEYPFVVASDGDTAILLLEGLTLHDVCETDQACTMPGARCAKYSNGANTASTGLCAASQWSLQRFALSESDLSEACDTDADCDPRHRCVVDPTSLILGQKSYCAPRQLVLGPSATNPCPLVTAGEFPSIFPKLRITPDDRVFFLTLDTCNTTINIDNNGVYAIDADLDPASVMLMEGAYDRDHDQSACYDAAERVFEYPICAIEIRDFDLSPDGALVMVGSAVNEAAAREIWLFDQRGRKYPLSEDIRYDVRSVMPVVP